MSHARTEITEAARRVGYIWNSLRPEVRDEIRVIDVSLAAELDMLRDLCAGKLVSDHMTGVNVDVDRRAENGYQPEHEFFWYCSCRPGKRSGDMGMLSSAHGARGIHEQDPTQFPGWLE